MNDITMLKKECREFFLRKRGAIAGDKRRLADRILFEKTVNSEEYIKADVLLVYYPVKGEIDVLPIVKKAFEDGKRIAFPVCDKEECTLTFRYVSSLDEMKVAAYNIPEPVSTAEVYQNNENTLCLVPALAFDRIGRRIGYGKGYYDRFLSRFDGVTMGLVYSELLVDELPVEETDVPIDIILSEREKLFICKEKIKKELSPLL